MIADVVAVGARGPLGLSGLQVAMSVRAGKLEPRSIRQRDKRDREIGIALTGGLGETLYGFHRFVALATPVSATRSRIGRVTVRVSMRFRGSWRTK